jgi:hypothetical protein
MKAVLYGRFKQGLHNGFYSHAAMVVSRSSLLFDVGFFFRDRYEFTPEQVNRLQTTDGGLRVYHNKEDCVSPIVFKVALFKSQNLSMRTIKRTGFVPRGRSRFKSAEKI